MEKIGFLMMFLAINIAINIAGNLMLCFQTCFQIGNREFLNIFPNQRNVRISYIFTAFLWDV